MIEAKSRARRFDERHSRLNEESEFFFLSRITKRVSHNDEPRRFRFQLRRADEIEPASGKRKRELSDSENRFSRIRARRSCQKWFNHNPKAISRCSKCRSQSQRTFAISKESRHVYPVGGGTCFSGKGQGRETVTDGIRPRERMDQVRRCGAGSREWGAIQRLQLIGGTRGD
ncbi:hypothetical protein ALC56_00862 [Trachymyrmex septentrionalis]|uniref:Uncharacterized protein n=1 Tax=Trachymyrmex septentrionalis TaxID=34720 RepID=A0A195FWR1_9HYME|nr:hypothetical protein ALC56_00862 [Trachymyrmex septentrionalis]